MTAPRVNLPDSPVVAIPVALTAVSVGVIGRDCVLCGFSLRESTGLAAADVDLIDGNDDTGTLLVTLPLPQGTQAREWPGLVGLAVQVGLRLKVNAGSVRGVIYVALPVIGGG